MATCNELSTLPPELRRRFTDGIVFFDLPGEFERGLLWRLYTSKYAICEIPGASCQEPPDQDGLTGAEIRNICRLARRMQVPLAEAALDVVPVIKSDRDGIDKRRRQAHGKYRCAARAGVYSMQNSDDAGTGRGLG